MDASAYPDTMRTIEEIRLDNFRALVDELARDLRRAPKNVEISAHLGVSTVYVHQLFKGSCSLIGNTTNCPACGKMTPCNADNMRLIAHGGGFRGSSTT